MDTRRNGNEQAEQQSTGGNRRVLRNRGGHCEGIGRGGRSRGGELRFQQRGRRSRRRADRERRRQSDRGTGRCGESAGCGADFRRDGEGFRPAGCAGEQCRSLSIRGDQRDYGSVVPPHVRHQCSGTAPGNPGSSEALRRQRRIHHQYRLDREPDHTSGDGGLYGYERSRGCDHAGAGQRIGAEESARELDQSRAGGDRGNAHDDNAPVHPCSSAVRRQRSSFRTSWTSSGVRAISIRRFSARPSRVSLLATGREGP